LADTQFLSLQFTEASRLPFKQGVKYRNQLVSSLAQRTFPYQVASYETASVFVCAHKAMLGAFFCCISDDRKAIFVVSYFLVRGRKDAVLRDYKGTCRILAEIIKVPNFFRIYQVVCEMTCTAAA
jgi:hypothetical protein